MSVEPPTVRTVSRRAGGGLAAALAVVIALTGLGAGPASAAAESSMQFGLMTITGKKGCPDDCADVITAAGEIDNDTADKFVTFLSDHMQDDQLRPVVLLQSQGGTVVGAMQLGTVFRTIGAAVIVGAVKQVGERGEAQVGPAWCLSACVYAFVGGVRRVVPPISRLGIHRMVINESIAGPGGEASRQQIFGSKDIVSSLSAYTRSMGVDPRMIAMAETIAPEQLHIVTAREIARWRLGRPRL